MEEEDGRINHARLTVQNIQEVSPIFRNSPRLTKKARLMKHRDTIAMPRASKMVRLDAAVEAVSCSEEMSASDGEDRRSDRRTEDRAVSASGHPCLSKPTFGRVPTVPGLASVLRDADS